MIHSIFILLIVGYQQDEPEAFQDEDEVYFPVNYEFM